MPSFPIKHKNDSSFNFLVSVLRMLLTFLVVLFISVTPVIGEVPVYSPVNTSCSKPWFVWQNHSCKCGNSLRRTVYCSADRNSIHTIKFCFCMTAETTDTIVGACPYTCGIAQTWESNATDLNHKLCNGGWNRTGRLCSQCLSGYGPLVYSYNMQCVPCPSNVVRDSIALYLASFLPLTVFCLVIITLRISGARPPLSTFILVSQVMSAPQYLSLIFVPDGKDFISRDKSYFVAKSLHDTCWKLFAAFFGLWNLDFFRSFYPQMCLSPHMTTLQAKFLEYIVALFPLVLLLFVYVGNKLYNRGYRLIFCILRPLVSCLARLRQTINVRTSLIDAFATFILLAINKVGYTSFIILEPVFVFRPDGSYSIKAYANPNIDYFGAEHSPYALTALFFIVTLVLIPLLLLFVYPLRSFQRFLSGRQWQCSTLHIFADTFQGCYKNGTNGTRDYRWFSGLHLMLRFIIIFFYDLSSYYQQSSLFMVVFISLYMSLISILQPYKKMAHLKMDIVLLFGLLLWCTSLSVSVLHCDMYGISVFVIHVMLLGLATMIPFIYFSSFLLCWLLVKKKFHLCMVLRLRQKFMRSTMLIDHSA